MDDYLVALIFGAFIVVVFAWDQFNRPSYAQSQELTRLIELLAPSDMRRQSVYWRAYLFYAGILLLIYITLCAYGALLFPILGFDIPGVEAPTDVGMTEAPTVAPGLADAAAMTGFTPELQNLSPDLMAGEAAPEDPNGGLATDPIVPLTVSLAIVGLAPSVPILQRIEEKIRFAAHRLSGIPTRLATGSRQLRQRSLDIEPGENTYLITPPDWDRMRHYAGAATGMLDDPTAFNEDIAKIIAFRSWILQEKLQLGSLASRDGMVQIEAGVASRIERLLFDLDALTGMEGAATATTSGRSSEQVRAAWEMLAQEADGICSDVCVLGMLYVEHGILPTEDDADRLGWGRIPDETAPEASHQRYLAQRKIMRFVSEAARWADRDSISLVLWARATAAALVVALAFGLFFGKDTVTSADSLVGTSRILIGITYLMSAMLTYALALLVALSYHQTSYQNGAWRNVFRDNWARWTPQLLAVFFLAGLAAVVCHVAYNIYATIGAVGWELVRANWYRVLAAAIEYEGPAAMRGPVLAILVILTIDAWRAGDRGEAVLDRMPLICGFVMGLTGILTRTLSSQVALGANFSFAASSEAIIGTGIVAGLIGLAVGFFVRATLMHEFPRARIDGPDLARAQAEAADVPAE